MALFIGCLISNSFEKDSVITDLDMININFTD